MGFSIRVSPVTLLFESGSQMAVNCALVGSYEASYRKNLEQQSHDPACSMSNDGDSNVVFNLQLVPDATTRESHVYKVTTRVGGLRCVNFQTYYHDVNPCCPCVVWMLRCDFMFDAVNSNARKHLHLVRCWGKDR